MFGPETDVLSKNRLAFHSLLEDVIETTTGKRVRIQDLTRVTDKNRHTLPPPKGVREFFSKIDGHFMWYGENSASHIYGELYHRTELVDGKKRLELEGGVVLFGIFTCRVQCHSEHGVLVRLGTWDQDTYLSSKELKLLEEFSFSPETLKLLKQQGLRTMREVMVWWKKNFQVPPLGFGRKDMDEIFQVATRSGLRFTAERK